MSFYFFDTSSVLNGRRDLLPPTTFPTLWLRLEALVELGQARAVDVVRDELSKREDESYQWARANTGFFVPLEEDVQLATAAVLRRHPKLPGKGGGRNGADPFVIGLALAREGVVVTEETPSGRLERPRIPDVCRAVGVPWMNLIGFVQDQGWSF